MFADRIETSLIAYYSLLAFATPVVWNSSVWISVATNIGHTLIMQKRAMRTIFGLGYQEHSKPYFIPYKILTVISQYILEKNHPGLVKSNPSLRIESNSYNIVIMYAA